MSSTATAARASQSPDARRAANEARFLAIWERLGAEGRAKTLALLALANEASKGRGA